MEAEVDFLKSKADSWKVDWNTKSIIPTYIYIYMWHKMYTRVYLLSAEMAVHCSTWSFFLRVLILRRSWFIWNWSARIFTTSGYHDVKPPPSPLIEVLCPLLQWFYPPLQGLLICYDYRTGVFSSFPSECFSTNPFSRPFHSDIREFLVSSSLSAWFQLLNFLYHEIEVPKKFHALEVLCIRRRHPLELWSDVTRCHVETERQDRTCQNVQ